LDAILDDLNTPKLLAEINKALHNPTNEIVSIIYRLDQNLLKLDLFDFSSLEDKKSFDIPEDIKQLAQLRFEAKQNKDWATADKIRDKLKLK
jgi:cysteinyl-tRNA synthetase